MGNVGIYNFSRLVTICGTTGRNYEPVIRGSQFIYDQIYGPWFYKNLDDSPIKILLLC